MGSSHDPHQPAYRPLPPPPRMRWAVVRASRTPKPFALVLGLVLSVFLRGPIQRHVPTWALTLWFAVSVLMWWWRIVRVPVDPPRVRVPTEYTMEEHRDFTDAGYVYDHEARVYRLRDEWDLDTQRRIDALMRAGLVEVETVEMPSARKEARRG